VGEDDLGGLDGVCDNCGIEIRYVFFIEHPKWNSMAVGTDCCDFLTGNSEATERRRLVDRKKRFVSSSRWKSLPHRSGAVISQTGIQLEIRKTNEQFQIFVDGISGKQRFSTELEARSTTFDLLSAGTIQDFLNRRKSGGRRN